MMSYASFLPTAGALPEVLQLLDNTGLRAQSATEKYTAPLLKGHILTIGKQKLLTAISRPAAELW
jgi:hypothetical protein